MPKKKPPSLVQLAASIYGCDVSDLLAHHEFEDGSVAIIAPTGQKFTYSADRILQESTKQPAPPPAIHPDKPVPNPVPQDETSMHASQDPAAPSANTRSPRSATTPKETGPASP